jgi:Raf kinase inhibitor-like YbhB/YbcL family protein
MALTLTSTSFKEDATLGMDHILSADYGFGCGGGNKSPQLSWTGVPAGTKSFAVHCFDPDAPTGSGFWHWVVVNIPASVTELKLDAGSPASGLLPKGALQTRTDFGKPGYGGPCPPPGAPHQYLITVYALKNKLDLDQHAAPALVGYYLTQAALARASLVVYGAR